jgi:hypothetical protein
MVDSIKGPARRFSPRRFSPVAEICRGSAGLQYAMENHLSISSRDVPLQNILHVIFFWTAIAVFCSMPMVAIPSLTNMILFFSSFL